MESTAIVELCKELGMPQEVTYEVAFACESTCGEGLYPFVVALTAHDTCVAAHTAISTQLEGRDEHGFVMLAVQLYAALHTRKLYQAAGISDAIFIDTMRCFPRFINEHFVTYGHYGFDRGWWTPRQLCMRLFRLGVLEFEWRPDATTISVHIPSDAVMECDALAQSYAMVDNFFAAIGRSHTGLVCTTWLLYPALGAILPKGSRILNFRKDYEIEECIHDAKSIMLQVFKRGYDDMNDLPEDTHLQREVKKVLLRGGNIGNARGRYVGK